MSIDDKKLTADRGAIYGHPLDDFRRADLIKQAVADCPDPEVRHALEMIGVKLARLVTSPDHQDTIDDIKGYAECINMIHAERKLRDLTVRPRIYIEPKKLYRKYPDLGDAPLANAYDEKTDLDLGDAPLANTHEGCSHCESEDHPTHKCPDVVSAARANEPVPVCSRCLSAGHHVSDCPDIGAQEEIPEPTCMQRKAETLGGGVQTWHCDLCHVGGTGKPGVMRCEKGRKVRRNQGQGFTQ